MRPLAILLYLLTILNLCVATAQTFTRPSDAVPGAALHKYLSTSEHDRELAGIGLEWDSRLGLHQTCSSHRVVKLTGLMIYVPVEFQSGSPHPVKGLWRERFSFERCGEIKTYNVLVSAQSAAQPRFAPLYPGDSLASPQLFLDARHSAFVLASVSLPRQNDGTPCQKISLLDTRVIRTPYEAFVPDRGMVRGVWDETWSVGGCGGVSEQLVTFTPDGKGGTYFTFGKSPNPASQPTR